MSAMRAVNTFTFIQKARSIHGDKYDYSRAIYVDTRTLVAIGCPTHGFVPMTSADHFKVGCTVCQGVRMKPRPHLIGHPRVTDTDSFIAKARAVHGDRYGYKSVRYLHSKIHVVIRCSEHGVFRQIPTAHLQGAGCPACGRDRVRERATRGFFENARALHGDRYDYTQVEYVDASTPVVIGCPVHGWTTQTPERHLAGVGCADCGWARRNKWDTEKFVSEARRIHGDRYDYSAVEYRRGDIHVEIICPIHGAFRQLPDGHLASRGCRRCASERISEDRSDGTDRFIEKARAVHGDLYDYSSVQYRRSKEHVEITCPVHGMFRQLPSNHLQGNGCHHCRDEKFATPYSTDEFIDRARATHGDRYDYANTEYVKRSDYVEIGCSVHGPFRQRAANHLEGHGCIKCGHESSRAKQRKTAQ